jgi:hypothetical protein
VEKSEALRQAICGRNASAKGLKSGKALLIQGGDLTIDSSDDSLHSTGQIQIQTGQLTISPVMTASMPIPP